MTERLFDMHRDISGWREQNIIRCSRVLVGRYSIRIMYRENLRRCNGVLE
jgi:hypothetical protein